MCEKCKKENVCNNVQEKIELRSILIRSKMVYKRTQEKAINKNGVIIIIIIIIIHSYLYSCALQIGVNYFLDYNVVIIIIVIIIIIIIITIIIIIIIIIIITMLIEEYF